jgi:hypothetical protein
MSYIILISNFFKFYTQNTWGERWGLNPRPPEPQSGALPTELRSPQSVYYDFT